MGNELIHRTDVFQITVKLPHDPYDIPITVSDFSEALVERCD